MRTIMVHIFLVFMGHALNIGRVCKAGLDGDFMEIFYLFDLLGYFPVYTNRRAAQRDALNWFDPC